MRFGTIASVLVGICYFLFAITFLFVPADLQPLAASPERYIPAEARRDLVQVLTRGLFALGSLLALAAVPAISRRVKRGDDDLLAWASALASLGLAVIVVTELRRATILPILGEAYARGDATLRAAIVAIERTTPLDPFGWLAFGGVGLWVFVASALAIQRRIGPPALAMVGIAVACLYWVVLIGFGTASALLVQLGVGVGGAVLAPVWYVWQGLAMRSETA